MGLFRWDLKNIPFFAKYQILEFIKKARKIIYLEKRFHIFSNQPTQTINLSYSQYIYAY